MSPRALRCALAQLGLMFALLPGPSVVAAELAAPWFARTLRIDGTTREYFVREPMQSPQAILLLLHGNGGSARALVSTERPQALHAWHALAEREALRLVIPEGMAGSEGRKG